MAGPNCLAMIPAVAATRPPKTKRMRNSYHLDRLTAFISSLIFMNRLVRECEQSEGHGQPKQQGCRGHQQRRLVLPPQKITHNNGVAEKSDCAKKHGSHFDFRERQTVLGNR